MRRREKQREVGGGRWSGISARWCLWTLVKGSDLGEICNSFKLKYFSILVLSLSGDFEPMKHSQKATGINRAQKHIWIQNNDTFDPRCERAMPLHWQRPKGFSMPGRIDQRTAATQVSFFGKSSGTWRLFLCVVSFPPLLHRQFMPGHRYPLPQERWACSVLPPLNSGQQCPSFQAPNQKQAAVPPASTAVMLRCRTHRGSASLPSESGCFLVNVTHACSPLMQTYGSLRQLRPSSSGTQFRTQLMGVPDLL